MRPPAQGHQARATACRRTQSARRDVAATGHHDEALRSFKRALTHKPDFFEAYVNAAQSLIDRGEPAEAVAIHERAVAANPGRAEPLINRGLMLDSIGRSEDAVASFDRALQHNPDSFEAWFNRGNACASMKRHEDAVASFEAASAIKPEFAIPFVNRGNSLLRLGRREDALASYEKAAALQSDLAAAHFGRAMTLEELGRFDAATEAFDLMLAMPAVRADPRFTARLRARRSAALAEPGRLEEARADADAALAQASDDDEVLYHVSNLDLLQGNWREGWECFERRLALGVGVPDDFKAPPFPRWTGEPLGIEFSSYAVSRAWAIASNSAVSQRSSHSAATVSSCGRMLIGAAVAHRAGCRARDHRHRIDRHAGQARWLPMMSLPFVLGTTPDTVPARVPYLAGAIHNVSPAGGNASGAKASRSGSRGRAAPIFASTAAVRCRSRRSPHSPRSMT